MAGNMAGSGLYWYDKAGNVIDRFQANKLMEDPSYRNVRQEEALDGTYVSTVWLGFDHGGAIKPMIFETMVFPCRGVWRELGMSRYATEEEALKGHEGAVRAHDNKKGAGDNEHTRQG